MSLSETSKAKQYAASAAVSAAECAIYANNFKKAPDYASAAAASATAAAQSASLSAGSAATAQSYSNSASSSATSAFESAESAGTAASAAVARCLRVPDGGTTDTLPVADDRKSTVLTFDSNGDRLVKPLSDFASLDGNGKVPSSQLPAQIFPSAFTVAGQEAMLALSANKGDIAKRTDLGLSFMLRQLPASTLSNWVQLNDDIIAELATSSGAGLSGFSQSSTYGYGTIGDKLSNVVYPTDAPFNAVDNITTDSSTALQNAINHCADNNKKLVLNGYFMITTKLTVPGGVYIFGATPECGIFSKVDRDFALEISGNKARLENIKVVGQNLPASTTIRQDGIYLNLTSKNCTLKDISVIGFFAKGFDGQADGARGVGLTDHGTFNRMYNITALDNKFGINLDGSYGILNGAIASNRYLTQTAEAKPWTSGSNYWDGLVSNRLQYYRLSNLVLYENGQSGIYVGGGGTTNPKFPDDGYSVGTNINNVTVFHNWNRGVDLGVFKARTATNDVTGLTLNGIVAYDNRENNIWLAGISRSSTINWSSRYTSNYNTLFAGYAGSHICLSLPEGDEGDAAIGNSIDCGVCVDPTGNAGVTLGASATGNIVGPSVNTSAAGDIYVPSASVITKNKISNYSNSFVPVFVGGSGTITLGTTDCRYTSHCDILVYDLTVNISSVSSPSGNLILGYLPGLSGVAYKTANFKVDYVNGVLNTVGTSSFVCYLTSSDQLIIARQLTNGSISFDMRGFLIAGSVIRISGTITL